MYLIAQRIGVIQFQVRRFNGFVHKYITNTRPAAIFAARIQVSKEVIGRMGIFNSIANLKAPFLNGYKAGGYSSGMVASGKITTLTPFFNRSAAVLNALKDEILLSRFTVISIVLKKKPSTILLSSSSLPIKQWLFFVAIHIAETSRFEVWLPMII